MIQAPSIVPLTRNLLPYRSQKGLCSWGIMVCGGTSSKPWFRRAAKGLLSEYVYGPALPLGCNVALFSCSAVRTTPPSSDAERLASDSASGASAPLLRSASVLVDNRMRTRAVRKLSNPASWTGEPKSYLLCSGGISVSNQRNECSIQSIRGVCKTHL